MRSIFITVPDFGYGPACCAADLVALLLQRLPLNVTFLSSGNALAFLDANVPDCQSDPIDVFDEDTWSDIVEVVGPSDAVICISQPPLAHWLAERGCQVILVDQLDWMWTDRIADTQALRGHIVQSYFSSSSVARSPGATQVRPILNDAFHRCVGPSEPSTEAYETVIAFGGMAVAGRPQASDAYAAWFLEALLPRITSLTGGCVAVVGGSSLLTDEAARRRWGYDGRVSLHRGLGRATYARMLRESTFQILSPGLATIYEAEALSLSPLFQPGANKSMLLQAEDLVSEGYGHVSRWTWQQEAVSRVRGLSQPQALKVIDGLIEESLRGAHGSVEAIQDSVSEYLRAEVRQKLGLAHGADPPAEEVLAGLLAAFSAG